VWAHFWAHSADRVEPFELPSKVGEFEAGVVAIGRLDRGVAHDPLRVERRHAGLREHGAERRPERVEVEHAAATSIASRSLDQMAFVPPASGTSRSSACRVTTSSTHSCAPRTAPSQSKSSARASRSKDAADVLRARGGTRRQEEEKRPDGRWEEGTQGVLAARNPTELSWPTGLSSRRRDARKRAE